MNPKPNAIAPATATRDEMREFIPAILRWKAIELDGSVKLSRMRELVNVTGWESLSQLTATATIPQLREACEKLLLAYYPGAAAPLLPEPPAEITVPVMPGITGPGDEPEDEDGDEPEDEDEDEDGDEFDKLAREAAALAKRMAAAKAKAAAKPAVAADPTLRPEFEAFRTEVRGSFDKLQDELKPLMDAVRSGGGVLPPRIVATVKAAISGDRMLAETMQFFIPGTAQPTIPAVASPPSFGKTYMADEIARGYDASFFHPFKDSLDEIDSLVGTLMPRSDGTFAVVDGPLVRAMRAAAAGMNTLFIGDEAFNASKKTMEWLLSTLSARFVEFDGKVQRCFVLQTKHSTESGDFEVLVAPEDKLNLLFCGNLRSNPPEAFMSRVTLLRFDYAEEWAVETALNRLHFYSGGVFDPADESVKIWAACWGKAMTLSRQRYSTMELARPLCFRFLIGAVSNVCRTVASPTLEDLSRYVRKYAPQQLAIQNAATQDTDEASFKVAVEVANLLPL